MGQVIIDHPKMVARWTNRLREMKDKYGIATASKWAAGMFSTTQIKLINEQLKNNN